jgi:hypothetical protein
MKKIITIVICLSLALSCLTGCGKDSGGSGQNIEGSLADILANLNAIYAEREDVKAAQAIIDENSPRLEELQGIIWSENHGLSDEELQELQKEEEELGRLIGKQHALLPAYTFEELLTPQGTEHNDNIIYFIGADDIPFTEGLVSESMMAYSVVLLRMEAGSDIEGAKTRIKEGVDPWKWVCAGVDPSNVVVDSIGDLVILIMADTSKELHESFLALAA